MFFSDSRLRSTLQQFCWVWAHGYTVFVDANHEVTATLRISPIFVSTPWQITHFNIILPYRFSREELKRWRDWRRFGFFQGQSPHLCCQCIFSEAKRSFHSAPISQDFSAIMITMFDVSLALGMTFFGLYSPENIIGRGVSGALRSLVKFCGSFGCVGTLIGVLASPAVISANRWNMRSGQFPSHCYRGHTCQRMPYLIQRIRHISWSQLRWSSTKLARAAIIFSFRWHLAKRGGAHVQTRA